jgi:Flp pilus assembly protein TadB
MVAMLLAGAGLGLGLLILGRSLLPARPDLAGALNRLSAPRRTLGTTPGHAQQVLVSLARALGMERLISGSIRTDLRLLNRSPELHLTRCLLVALESALIAPVLVAVLALGGVRLPIEIPVGLVLACGLAGAVLPSVTVRAEAVKRRRAFTHALGAFLDLVAVNLAAGRGVEGALDTAAGSGGWAFGEIRQSLYRAKVMGETPWAGLDQLGSELGIADLRELAASVGLAGDSGAKVRASLAAKARALRVKGLADAEEAAQAASERMSLPVILLLCGFVLFIGFPAIARVVEGI